MTSELDSLASLAVAADGADSPAQAAPGAPGAPPTAPAGPDYRAEAHGTITCVRELVRPILPRVAAIYTDETIARLSDAAAPLMRKYGITLGSVFDRWGEELQFALVALPVAIETARTLRDELADKRGRRAAPPAAPTSPADQVAPVDQAGATSSAPAPAPAA